ncbi:MAG TPA: pilin [Candidatus Saccharimonadia bacterium]|nr:pilin [Candidatus Saccharimonadia bacterium]
MLSSLVPKIFAVTCSPSQTFFGLPVWYKYIKVTSGSNGCNFSSFSFWPPDNLFLIVLAVLDMLFIVGGIVAVIFVIYGGVQYILSQGNPDNTKKAQGTIINAVIGLVITILAATLVNFLGYKLGG